MDTAFTEMLPDPDPKADSNPKAGLRALVITKRDAILTELIPDDLNYSPGHRTHVQEARFTSRRLSQSILEAFENEEPRFTVIIVQADKTSSYLETVLRHCCPGVPSEIFRGQDANNQTSLLPVQSYKTTGRSSNGGGLFREFRYGMEHIFTNPRATKDESEHIAELSRTDVWILKNGRVRGNVLKEVSSTFGPLAIVFGRVKHWHILAETLRKHYKKRRHPYRRSRIIEEPRWLFYDLLKVVTRWDGVWTMARDRYNDRRDQIYREKRHASPLGLTKSVFGDIGITLNLQEQLRLHQAFSKAMLQCLDSSGRGGDSSDNPVPSTLKLKEAIEELLAYLDYYLPISEVLLQELYNLQNLILNMEQVAQSIYVGRLTVMATIFLPLSFLTSIFGMTEFTVSPKWYPVVAVPLLCFVLAAIVAADRLFPGQALAKESVTPIKPLHRARTFLDSSAKKPEEYVTSTTTARDEGTMAALSRRLRGFHMHSFTKARKTPLQTSRDIEASVTPLPPSRDLPSSHRNSSDFATFSNNTNTFPSNKSDHSASSASSFSYRGRPVVTNQQSDAEYHASDSDSDSMGAASRKRKLELIQNLKGRGTRRVKSAPNPTQRENLLEPEQRQRLRDRMTDLGASSTREPIGGKRSGGAGGISVENTEVAIPTLTFTSAG